MIYQCMSLQFINHHEYLINLLYDCIEWLLTIAGLDYWTGLDWTRRTQRVGVHYLEIR